MANKFYWHKTWGSMGKVHVLRHGTSDWTWARCGSIVRYDQSWQTVKQLIKANGCTPTYGDLCSRCFGFKKPDPCVRRLGPKPERPPTLEEIAHAVGLWVKPVKGHVISVTHPKTWTIQQIYGSPSRYQWDNQVSQAWLICAKGKIVPCGSRLTFKNRNIKFFDIGNRYKLVPESRPTKKDLKGWIPPPGYRWPRQRKSAPIAKKAVK